MLKQGFSHSNTIINLLFSTFDVCLLNLLKLIIYIICNCSIRLTAVLEHNSLILFLANQEETSPLISMMTPVPIP